jgi:CubicO group peptidase (beta-lactamase class C family)
LLVIGLVDDVGALPLRAGTLSVLAHRHRVPGAQLAIHHDGRIAAVEFGEREIRTGRRVTRDTAFPIGSITKSFTATLAMILVADGDLEMDAPFGDYLPELDDPGARYTLRQVLSHTSGLASDPESADTCRSTARRLILDHCRQRNVVLAPDTGFSYSNMGYVLAGWLIEAITGMGWWEATESILLRPLGIEPAVIGEDAPGDATRTIAVGHSVNVVAGRTRPVPPVLEPAEAATAALAMSAADLVSLGLLHLDPGRPDLLPAAYARHMRQPVAAAEPFGLADGWGLGLACFRHGSTAWVGHDGNSDGTSCYLRIDPANGWVIAFTSNANSGSAMWHDLQVELARAGVPIGPAASSAPHAPPTAPPRGCVGTYANGDIEFVVTTREAGRVYLGVDGELAALTFHEDLSFSLRDPSSGQLTVGGRFVRDPATGRLDAIQINGRLARRTATTRAIGRQRVA